MTTRSKPENNPAEIADYLVSEHGLEGALETAVQGSEAAKQTGDNYSLSVWREVKRMLKERLAEEGENHT